MSMVGFLREIPLFEDLPEEDLEKLCPTTAVEEYQAGEIVFVEGDIGRKAYVIIEGELDILKKSGGKENLLATRRAGEVVGEMSLLNQAPRFASGRTRTASKLLSIEHTDLDNLLDSSPSAARVMLGTITNRLRNTELILRQSEKMAQIGTLTAGIAHELNNPASAVRRSSEELGPAFENFQSAYLSLQNNNLSDKTTENLQDLKSSVKETAKNPAKLDSLARAEREEKIENWLSEKGIDDGWDFAPVIAEMDYSIANLNEFENIFPAGQLRSALEWICAEFRYYSLVNEIHQGSARISEIVKSMKSYVYLDQDAIQSVDIHEGINNTLIILSSKLKKGINLERRFSESLPKIQAYGSELNQVWTNIIDNAIDAMDGKGDLSIFTSQENGWIKVDFVDSGPGIPSEIKNKLFNPFFTTKPVGKGTGLGLNISYNIVKKHKGEILVESEPGKTRFSVILPLNFNEAEDDF